MVSTTSESNDVSPGRPSIALTRGEPTAPMRRENVSELRYDYGNFKKQIARDQSRIRGLHQRNLRVSVMIEAIQAYDDETAARRERRDAWLRQQASQND